MEYEKAEIEFVEWGTVDVMVASDTVPPTLES